MTALPIRNLAGKLFDLLAEVAPEGRTRDDLMADLGITDVGLFHQVKGELQDVLAGDRITVVGDSSTNNDGGWTYSLQGDPNNPISKEYVVQRARGLHSRHTRSYNIVQAWKNGTRANSKVGIAVRDLLESERRAVMDTMRVLISLGVSNPDTDEDGGDSLVG